MPEPNPEAGQACDCVSVRTLELYIPAEEQTAISIPFPPNSRCEWYGQNHERSITHVRPENKNADHPRASMFWRLRTIQQWWCVVVQRESWSP